MHMGPRIRQRFTDAVLREAMRRYGISQNEIRPLGGFVNFTYEYQHGPHCRILRFSHTLRRSVDLVRGELDWLRALSDARVPVAYAVHSQQGNLLEVIEDGVGDAFIATAHIKAPGVPPWETDWPIGFRIAYGQVIGRMHAVSQSYRPANPAWRRPDWDEGLAEFVEWSLADPQNTVRHKYLALCEELRRLPKDETCYGLTHQDAQQSNFMVDEAGVPTLFDFDDCRYSWYVHDVAIVLFFITFYFGTSDEHKTRIADIFMPSFLQGYRDFKGLSGRWLGEIPKFLKLCEIEMYMRLRKGFDANETLDAFCRRFMDDRKRRIEQDAPYIDFDFESLEGPA